MNQRTNDWLASQPASQVDRLNSIVQVIITVLLNTLIAECVCLAFLSGSVPFELFIHLGHFLFIPYECITHTYKLHLLSIILFLKEWHIYICIYRYYNYCKSTPTPCQPRNHSSSIVSSDDVSSLRHIYMRSRRCCATMNNCAIYSSLHFFSSFLYTSLP